MGTKRTLKFQQPRKCVECGKLFIPKSGTQKYCNGPHITKCLYCGKELTYTCSPRDKPNYCSKECREADKKRKLLEKYGVDNVSKLPSVREKISKANSSKEVQDKRKQTCLEKYGAENPFQSEEIKQKIKEDNLKKYGVENSMQRPEIAAKISAKLSDPEHIEAHKQHLFEKYGVYDTNDIPGVKEKTIKTNMEKYGVPYYVLTDEYQNPEVSAVISKINKENAKELEALGFKTEFEFVIDRKSYDLHILDTNILIEINPTYTHNIIGNHWDKVGKDINYHKDKTKLAIDNGYQCINIWDWDNSEKIYKSLLQTEIIPVDLCIVKKISEKTAKTFETSYSIKSDYHNQQYCYGLYFMNQLIAIMTFGKSIYNSNYEYELINYCTKFNYKIIDGYKKLFEYALDDIHLASIIYYADLSKFNKEIYEELNFNYTDYIQPIMHWANRQNEMLDIAIQEQLQVNDDSYYDSMIDDGWLPVYDCGQAVYTWNKC